MVFAPALEYAVGAARNVKFYGRDNDGSWADFFDRFNDVYIDGKLQYGNRLIGEDEYKYDVACQGDVSLPDFFDSRSDFRDYFQSMADTVYDGDKFFGKRGGTWHTVGDDQIVFVKGDVEIGENVDRWWQKAVDVTVIATGDITVNSGDSGDDDRLVLIAYKNVTMKGNRSNDVLNSVILAGQTFKARGYRGWAGGRGEINGLVTAKNIDMKGYDPLERSGGWKIVQDMETLMMNGGIEVLESDIPALITFSSEVGELRNVSLSALMKARKQEISRWSASDVAFERTHAMEMLDLYEPDLGHVDCYLVPGESPEEQGRNLAKKLLEEMVSLR